MTMQKPDGPHPLMHKMPTARPVSSGIFGNLPDLLTVQDMKALTGLSEQTIRTEINNGGLPGCRIGRRLYVPKVNLINYVITGGSING